MIPSKHSFSLTPSKYSKTSLVFDIPEDFIMPAKHSFSLISAKGPIVALVSDTPVESREKHEYFIMPSKHSFSLVPSPTTPTSAAKAKEVKKVTKGDSDEPKDARVVLVADAPVESREKQIHFMMSSNRSFMLTPKQDPRVALAAGAPVEDLDIVDVAMEGPEGLEENVNKDKRAFLKAAGIAGAGLVASQLMPTKADALILGSSPTTGIVGVKDSTNARINPATEETVDSILKTADLDLDGSGALSVNIASGSTGSFSDSGDVSKLALVDGDRHVQVDVLSSELPTSASTESTLQTISFGGVKYALQMMTVGNYDYIGEASIGSATSASSWRVKRVDNSSGNISLLWAGSGTFNQVWDNYASLSYS